MTLDVIKHLHSGHTKGMNTGNLHSSHSWAPQEIIKHSQEVNSCSLQHFFRSLKLPEFKVECMCHAGYKCLQRYKGSSSTFPCQRKYYWIIYYCVRINTRVFCPYWTGCRRDTELKCTQWYYTPMISRPTEALGTREIEERRSVVPSQGEFTNLEIVWE